MDWLKDHYNLEQHLGGNELAVPSLDRMRTLMTLLGDPQHDVPAIHITGTNGKGSTSRMVVELYPIGCSQTTQHTQEKVAPPFWK